jgi:ATP-binding cassette subfamily C protein CydD
VPAPLDPRLIREVPAARHYVILTALAGVASAALIIIQALVVASAVAPLVTHHHLDSALLVRRLWALGLIAIARAVVAFTQERLSARAAANTVADLRERVIRHAVTLGPRRSDEDSAAVATLATRGLDALIPYLTRYLPALWLAALVTPAVLIVLGFVDWLTLVICLVTVPLIPVFMTLIGKMTAGTSEKRLAVINRLGSQVLDLLAGLPTLKAYGREMGPGARVRSLGNAARQATMGTLKIAFLSSMVLELVTTISVAIVAVSVGLRLVEGHMTLFAGLVCIMLAPEVFLPLRQVAMQFHASTDGLAAASAAFAILDDESSAVEPGTFVPSVETPMPDLSPQTPANSGSGDTIILDNVSVHAGDRAVDAPSGLTATIPLDGGRIVALVGPTGSGKSTTALLMLGLLTPDRGTVTLPCARVEDWWKRVLWIPQRPALSPGTIREAVCGEESTEAGPSDADSSDAGPSDDALEAAARLTGLDVVVATLPHGWNTRIGLGGVGLSVGQRQRVALASGLLTAGTLVAEQPQANPAPIPGPHVIILDEPTAHLDAAGEQVILDACNAWRDAGRTVVVIAHRESLIRLADQVIEVHSTHTSPELSKVTP